jgi:hypothetical protein
MPYQGSSRLADLLIQQGQIHADRAQRGGQMWGNVVRGVASLPDRIAARRQAEQDAELQRRQQAGALENAGLQRQVLQGQIASQQRNVRLEDEDRALAKKTQAVQDWLMDVASNSDPDVMQAGYRSGRDQLIQAGVLTEQDAPAFFPGQSWVRAKMAQVLPAAQRFQQMFPAEPEGFTLNPGDVRFDGRGNELAAVPEAPPAPSNPTEASLAAAAAGGDPNAREALRLLRAQGAPRGPAAVRQPVWVVQNGQYVDLAGVAPPGSQPANVREQARPVTGAERKTLGFFQRMLEAERNARAVEDSVGGRDFAAEWLPGSWLENFAKTPEGQRYTQAQRTFTEARLRKESGAAIPQGEYDTDRDTNFRRANDDTQTIAQKRAARLRLLRSAANEAGRSLSEYYGDGATIDSILSEFSAPETRRGGAAGSTPNLSGLRPGTDRKFSSGPFAGQTWTIENGQAVQVE